MEESAIFHGTKEEVVEEDHVLIDLDDIFGQVHINPNAPYVLSVMSFSNATTPFCFFWYLSTNI